MNRVACAAFILCFADRYSFPQSIDPRGLQVDHVCGVTLSPGSELTLTSRESPRHAYHAKSDASGRFLFLDVPRGRYKLSVHWRRANGGVFAPIHNSYPLRVKSSSSDQTCKEPLIVTETEGSESGLDVRYQSVRHDNESR